MAITVDELRIGRKTDLKKAERQFVIKGTTSEGGALGALFSNAPSSVNGMAIDRSGCNVEEIATNLFVGTVTYAAPGDPSAQSPGSFSISFDISGQTVHYNQAINHINNYAAPGQPSRLFRGAINVDEDGKVNGVDVVVPTMTMTVNYTVDPSLINESYIATISRMVGSVNDDTFKGFEAGELLLTRISGSRRDTDNWDIQFGFSVSENKTDLTVGDITGIEKKGWDFLWVYYVAKEDPDNNVLLQYPASANVEQVYHYKDFGVLGLP